MRNQTLKTIWIHMTKLRYTLYYMYVAPGLYILTMLIQANMLVLMVREGAGLFSQQMLDTANADATIRRMPAQRFLLAATRSNSKASLLLCSTAAAPVSTATHLCLSQAKQHREYAASNNLRSIIA